MPVCPCVTSLWGRYLKTISSLGTFFKLFPPFSYRRLRDETNAEPRQILINLCLAFFFLYLIFLVGIDQVSHRNLCIFVAFVLQYLTLVSPMWIAVEAFNLYQSLVRDSDEQVRHFVPKATIIAWGKF